MQTIEYFKGYPTAAINEAVEYIEAEYPDLPVCLKIKILCEEFPALNEKDANTFLAIIENL